MQFNLSAVQGIKRNNKIRAFLCNKKWQKTHLYSGVVTTPTHNDIELIHVVELTWQTHRKRHVTWLGYRKQIQLRVREKNHIGSRSVFFFYYRFSCTQDCKECWSWSQLSSGKGDVRPRTRQQFIKEPPPKKLIPIHTQSYRQFQSSQFAWHAHYLTVGGCQNTHADIWRTHKEQPQQVKGPPSHLQPSCCEATALNAAPSWRPGSRSPMKKKGKRGGLNKYFTTLLYYYYYSTQG